MAMRLFLDLWAFDFCCFRLLPLQDPVDAVCQRLQPLDRLARDTQAVVMPGEHAPDDLVFLQEDGDGFLFINPRLVSIGLGILRERLLQVGGDAM